MRWLAVLAAPAGAGLLTVASVAGGPARAPSAAQAPTSISVDVIPAGNTATTIDSVQACAAAEEGDEFIVDIVLANMTDLLAWELQVTYDPEVLEVTGRDVDQQFQSSNEGSQILDFSDEVPDDDGRYELQAADTADPPAPDSGSGTLARLTMRAKGQGTSQLSLAPVDIDEDGRPDRGILLRTAGGDAYGDTDGDSIFDGPAADAEIRVGERCTGEDSENVVQEVNGSTDPDNPDNADDGDGDGSDTTLVAGAIAAAIAGAAALAIVAFLRRRRAA